MNHIELMEADIAGRVLRDPKLAKQIAIAWRHDHSLPLRIVAALGPRATQEEIVRRWGEMVDARLASSTWGDLSADGRFDQWLARLYAGGSINWEDLAGEAVDALGVWRALSERSLLQPRDQDFMRFRDLENLQRIQNRYQGEIQRLKNQAVIDQHRREKKETVLINDDRFMITIPYNYGSCYTFNNAQGHHSNFCTGSSSGLSWFKNYAPDGMIISVLDKPNMNDKNGKWQIHAPTSQIVNSTQDNRGDTRRNDDSFATLFPGLMQRIAEAIRQHADEITANSMEIRPPNGYDIERNIAELRRRFPASWASEAPVDAAAMPAAAGTTPPAA